MLRHPNQIDGDTAAELIALKLARSAWGPKKIRELYLRSYPNKEPPSLSSVKRILDKAGLVVKRKNLFLIKILSIAYSRSNIRAVLQNGYTNRKERRPRIRSHNRCLSTALACDPDICVALLSYKLLHKYKKL